MAWEGSQKQYDALLSILRELDTMSVPSLAIERSLLLFKSSKKFVDRHFHLISTSVDRTTISRWTKLSSLKDREYRKCELLYVFFLEDNTYWTQTLSKLKADPAGTIEKALQQAFGFHAESSNKMASCLSGKYQCFQYSEIFNASPNFRYGIVLASLSFEHDAETGYISAEETQKFDGRVLVGARKEHYFGSCCFADNRLYVFLRNKGSGKLLKVYIFYEFEDDDESDVENYKSLKGYMLKSSNSGNYFHSPVYIIRSHDKDIDCKILLHDEVSDNIVRELSSGLRIQYA